MAGSGWCASLTLVPAAGTRICQVRAKERTVFSGRLAAILAADIAGYSALMGADEARTVQDLKGHQAVVLPMIGQFGGRIIDTAGDGILAEFKSVANAVECAVAIQDTMRKRTRDRSRSENAVPDRHQSGRCHL